MRVLVLGATGMLGNATFRVLFSRSDHESIGTIRGEESKLLFPRMMRGRLRVVDDLLDRVRLARVLDTVQPDVVVNCVGVRKASNVDEFGFFRTLALLPRRLSLLCAERDVRLVHISSDGVFSGARGRYREADAPDADDLYGVAKLLGEVDGSHCVTIRTSILGPELVGGAGLLEWFLSQSQTARCYTMAIFSGFPTVVLAEILRDYVIPDTALHGIYHISSPPISKFDLLTLVAGEYGKQIDLTPDDSHTVDRSLISDRFREATGYSSPDWRDLVKAMRASQDQLTRG